MPVHPDFFFSNSSCLHRPHPPSIPFQVEGGEDKGLPVSGKLPETRCRFVLPSRGNTSTTMAATGATAGTARSSLPRAGGSIGGEHGKSSSGGGSSGVLDFGHASVGVDVRRTVMLQNTGKSQAAFFVDTSDLTLVRRE